MEVWLKDIKTGIECGVNNDGDLFLGNDRSGYNLPDTPRNREKIVKEFCRYTDRQMPVITANGKPFKGDISMTYFRK